MDYINADEIKKNLKCSDYEAAELAERQRETHLQNNEEFKIISRYDKALAWVKDVVAVCDIMS